MPDTTTRSRRADPFDALCELRVADSVFLGYVLPVVPPPPPTTTSSLASPSSTARDDDDDDDDDDDEDEGQRREEFDAVVLDFRRRLIEERHPGASHVPWCAVASVVDGTLSASQYDDDGEPPGAGVGRALLCELRRHARRLERQPTMRMRGGSSSSSSYRGGRIGVGGGVDATMGRRRRPRGAMRSGSWDGGEEEEGWGGDEGDDDEEEDDGDDDEGEGRGGGIRPPARLDSSSPPSAAPSSSSSSSSEAAAAVIVVRYFGNRHLGVTSGRLRGVYARTARLALHRHANGKGAPLVERHRVGGGAGRGGGRADGGGCLYGLGAGDAELIPGVAREEEEDGGGGGGDDGGIDYDDAVVVVRDLLRELEFERMVGPAGAPLPRLQNLQADLLLLPSATAADGGVVVPVYRYPGNYSGLEYPTHPWSRTSMRVKRAVESALRPLYPQVMSHCVANLYRDGRDGIDRHSDKDLDLNRDGVIVSVSFGSCRVLELRNRAFPHDASRVDLPHGSMFVLGPHTNAAFTHAVLSLPPPNDDRDGRDRRRGCVAGGGDDGGSSTTADATTTAPADGDDDVRCDVGEGGRISLTFRDVRTFLDVKTQRLFGQGVSTTPTKTTATTTHPPPLLPTQSVGNKAVRDASLAAALRRVREQDGRERRSAAVIASVLGATAGYVVSSSGVTNKGGARAASRDGSLLALLLRAVSTAVTAGSASYWYIRRRRREERLKLEEDEARAFFSKKSASGNKY